MCSCPWGQTVAFPSIGPKIHHTVCRCGCNTSTKRDQITALAEGGWVAGTFRHQSELPSRLPSAKILKAYCFLMMSDFSVSSRLPVSRLNKLSSSFLSVTCVKYKWAGKGGVGSKFRNDDTTTKRTTLKEKISR